MLVKLTNDKVKGKNKMPLREWSFKKIYQPYKEFVCVEWGRMASKCCAPTPPPRAAAAPWCGGIPTIEAGGGGGGCCWAAPAPPPTTAAATAAGDPTPLLIRLMLAAAAPLLPPPSRALPPWLGELPKRLAGQPYLDLFRWRSMSQRREKAWKKEYFIIYKVLKLFKKKS